METIEKRFENFITAKHLINKSDKILVALSGGADSVMLIYMLLTLREKFDLTVEAFHLNHHLRAQASEDEMFVKSLCEDQDIVCHIYNADIRAISQEQAVSLEEAGRIERYRILDEIMGDRELTSVATAHHMDDNAETVIMRLIRGTGLYGLEGIPLKRENIIRPLMFLTKEEIIDYLNNNHIPYVTDQTNFDGDYFRNRVRMDILPLLKKENNKIAQSIMRLSEIARINREMIEYYADRITLSRYDDTVVVRYDDIASAHDMIKGHVLKKMAECNEISKDIHYEHMQSIIKLINKNDHTTWDYMLPGIVFKRRYDQLTARKTGILENQDKFSYRIGINGVYIFPKEKFILKISKLKKIEKNHSNQYIKAVDYDKIKHILIVRNKQQGDFFYPINLGGKKSLKKLFIDKKIHKENRTHIPIICENGNIVYILGIDIDDRYKITQDTQNYLLIEYLPMENTNE